jgi:2-keto-4-pentenoate hydratase/2-oxohepta-3-ene-1,7-dioic acid hydratase in catechol pathway
VRALSFATGTTESFGVVIDADVADLGDQGVPSLRAALAAWGPEGLRQRASRPMRRIPLSAIRYLPPITNSDKILCVGLNYYLHAKEAGMAVPKHPSIFVRFPGSQVGHNEPVWRPRASAQFDYEAELAVVIGDRGRNVAVERAMDLVFGYSCFAENSVRDYQRHSNQATPGKNFQYSGAFGPWIVTPDEAGDPQAMKVIGRLNGVEMQNDSAGNMIFSIPELIAYASSFLELLPGDVIVTGTPAGVGFTKQPPLYMRSEDTFEVEITGVGVLRNSVIDEPH